MTVFPRQCRNNFIKYESNHLAILVRRSSSNSSSNTRSSFTKSGKVEIWIIYFLVPTLPLHISQYKQIIHIPGFTKQNINANCPSLNVTYRMMITVMIMVLMIRMMMMMIIIMKTQNSNNSANFEAPTSNLQI